MLNKFETYYHLNEILDKVEKSWSRIIKNGYKGSVSYNIEKSDIKIKIKFSIKKTRKDSESYGTYVKKTRWNRWLIKIDTSIWEEGTNVYKMKNKDKIFSDLAHEITHIGQYYNGFSNYVEIKLQDEWKKEKSKLSYNKWYDKNHSNYPTEKEAVMFSFFEYLKRDKLNSYNYLMGVPHYFDLYSYKKLINKAIKYGVEIEDIYYIKDELKKYLDEKNEKIKNNIFSFSNIFQEIELKINLFKQFNVEYKPNLQELKKLLDETNPKRVPNYKITKNKIEELLK